MTDPDAPKPRRASPLMVALATAVTIYFSWVLLFAREGQSTAMLVLYVLAVLANAAFLAAVIRRWLQGRGR